MATALMNDQNLTGLGLPGTLTGHSTGSYTVTGQPAAPLVVTGASITFTVQFAPTTAGLLTLRSGCINKVTLSEDRKAL